MRDLGLFQQCICAFGLGWAEDIAEEIITQCTKFSIHSFANQMSLLRVFFRLSLLSNLETNPIADAPENFLECEFLSKCGKSDVNLCEREMGCEIIDS